MPVKINGKSGIYSDGVNHTQAIIALAKAAASSKISSVSALTDNSTGSATSNTVLPVTAFSNAANAATNLAQKAATETALGKVKDAVKELATKINAINTKLGLDTVTDNSGGAAADGTIAAMDVAVTAATTGAQATETNAIRLVINDAFRELVSCVNQAATAVGVEKVTCDLSAFASRDKTIAAISTGTGTAADPGITKVAMDAALTKWANNVAVLAAKINEVLAAPAQIVVV